ncbi:hypothetical protein EVAR_947_1 [Eumeta japonica]|uniref:Uncharacterized protein n=1 Tax=Eumeta variegata TaxID=151549 RepID=A0A4C1SE80_EUMVA|nr:hypothetical protein EVAR_947_1 [Eumeta japonica]
MKTSRRDLLVGAVSSELSNYVKFSISSSRPSIRLGIRVGSVEEYLLLEENLYALRYVAGCVAKQLPRDDVTAIPRGFDDNDATDAVPRREMAPPARARPIIKHHIFLKHEN